MNLVDSLYTYNYPNYDYYKDIAEKIYKKIYINYDIYLNLIALNLKNHLL